MHFDSRATVDGSLFSTNILICSVWLLDYIKNNFNPYHIASLHIVSYLQIETNDHKLIEYLMIKSKYIIHR